MKATFWSPSLSTGYNFRSGNWVLFIGLLKTQQSGILNTWANLNSNYLEYLTLGSRELEQTRGKIWVLGQKELEKQKQEI